MWVQSDNERQIDSTGEYAVEVNTDSGARRRGRLISGAGC